MTSLSPVEKIALGLLAGAIGTAVMTLGQKAEMAATGRKPSTTPSQAVEKVSGIELSEKAEKQASTPIHFAYGTALGVGLAALDGVREPLRTGAFFAGAYGSGQVLLVQLGLAEPPNRQKPVELVTELAHHLVYAVAASAAYTLLAKWIGDRRSNDDEDAFGMNGY